MSFRAYLEGLAQFEGDMQTYRETLVATDRLAIEEAERNGALAAFVDAVAHIKVQQPPRNLERYFLSWLKACQPAVVPKEHLEALIAEFRGRITVYQFSGIAAVVSDGYLRTFIPYAGKESRAKAQAFQHAAVLEGWLRSRYGYVAGKGAFFEAMRANRTSADFARLVQ